MLNRLADFRLFFKEFRRNYHHVGAILPSGQRLSMALARFVGEQRNGCPRRILEVGPGTGAATRHIIRQMGPQDTLDLVEINPRFVECLNERFRDDPEFQPVSPRAKVHCTPIENLSAATPYDIIVSGLPLNNFAVADVERILGILSGLAGKGSTITFFEYMGIRRFKAAISGRSERARLRGIEKILNRLFEVREVRRDWVWSNVPPAWVHHLQF